LPSYECQIETLPLLDSNNPDFQNNVTNEPLVPDWCIEKIKHRYHPLVPPPPVAPPVVPPPVVPPPVQNVPTPPPPVSVSVQTTPVDLASVDSDFINQLLNTIKILRNKEKVNEKIKAEDERIKKEQKDKIEDLTKKYHSQGEELRQARHLLASIRSRAITSKQKKDIIESVMGKFGYSKTQLDCFLRGSWQRVKGWTEADVKFALSLRTISRKAYRFIRDKKLIPLPGESTLRKYMKNLQVPPGHKDTLHFTFFIILQANHS